jgi:hypothetical protein
VTLYEIESRFYSMPKVPITENGSRREAEWLTKDEVLSGDKVLYPEAVQGYV